MLFLQKTQATGLLGQLQSQLQQNGHEEYRTKVDEHLPESWKWENQMNVKARKERKGINKITSQRKKEKKERKLAAKEKYKKEAATEYESFVSKIVK